MYTSLSLKRRLRKIFAKNYKSETAKVRNVVLPYCIGFGCDVGFGGDKIVKNNCLGIDFTSPYSIAGKEKVDIPCDLSKENIPVSDNYFDYVYSSHLIEDFEDTKRLLKDFIRILKSGGNLILVFPDQSVYEKICAKTGQPLNQYHVHKDMGFAYMQKQLLILQKEQRFNATPLYNSNCEIDYNVVMIWKIIKTA